MGESDKKTRALEHILQLAEQHHLSPEEIARALTERMEGAASVEGKGSLLTRLFGYIGGIFIFAGLATFIGMQWENMNAAARIVVTLCSGIAAFAMALVALRDPRFEKAATPLFLIAAVLQPVGILVAFHELSLDDDEYVVTLVTTGAMALQQGLAFYATRRTTLLFMTLLFSSAFVGTLMDRIDMGWDLIGLAVGSSLLSLCYGIDRTGHKAITPFWYFCGSSFALAGLFELVEGSFVELLFMAAAVGFVFLSTLVRSRTLLFVATISMLAYIGYYTSEHFVDVLGWPIALMVFGMLMIGLSALAFRINRRYITGPASNT